MLKFFRQIRQNLLSEGKTGQYLKYAFGEIFLVVIGILIALQVNNWNQRRLESEKLKSYYIKLLEEVDGQILIANLSIERTDKLIAMQNITLDILKSKDKSRTPELIENIGSVPMIMEKKYSMPILKEFINQNLLAKVDDPSLKQILSDIETILVVFESKHNYTQIQYNNLIEPYFAKHINYAQVAFPTFRDRLVQGGPATDFELLFNSMELWNIVTLKLETTTINNNKNKKFLNLLNSLKSVLKKEIVND